MKKKNDEKKGAGRLLGYCPFSVCTGSRYNNLYRDTGLGRLAWARVRGTHGRPRYGWLGHNTAHDTAKGGHDTAGSARARPG